MSEVFCDALGVTVPEGDWESLRDLVAPCLDAVGLSVEFQDARTTLWRHAETGGTAKAFQRSGVWAVGVSGKVCAAMRAIRVFDDFLASVGSHPHRVTRLDASLDVGTDAAPVVRQIAAIGQQGGLRLTRKSIHPKHVTTFLGVRDDGALSGTVYAGSRTADVRMVVYDKTKERQDAGVDCADLITRYELRLRSGVGVTLRDVADPAPVFWHYASPSFLPCPSGVPPWAPFGEGFAVERREPPTPAARMAAIVAQSVDVGRLLDLASQPLSGGVDFLTHLIRARAAKSEGASRH